MSASPPAFLGRPTVTSKLAIASFWGLVVAKVMGLVWFGPLIQPDSGGYESIARLMASDWGWLAHARLATEAAPATLFRPLGYPGLLSLSGLVFGWGPAHDYAVIVIQFAMSLIATVLVFRVGVILLRSQAWALIAAGGYALSIAFTYDQHVLTDSLFNSFFVMSLLIPARGILSGDPPRYGTLILLGGIYAAACTVRGIGLYFFVLVLPGVVWWAMSVRKSIAQAVSRTASYLVLVVVVVGGVMTWNDVRTGHAVFSTGGQYVLIQAMVEIGARGGPNLFDGDTPVDLEARKRLHDFSYDEVVRITNGLFKDYGIEAIESARLHRQVFLRSLKNHLPIMLFHGVTEYEERLVHQFFNVLDNAKNYLRFTLGRKPWPGISKLWKRLLSEGRPVDFLLVVLTSLFRVFAWASFIGYAIGIPALMAVRWRKGTFDRETALLGYLWCVYFAYTYGLCVVYVADRFVPAVLPAGLIGSLYLLQRGIEWGRARASAGLQRG